MSTSDDTKDNGADVILIITFIMTLILVLLFILWAFVASEEQRKMNQTGQSLTILNEIEGVKVLPVDECGSKDGNTRCIILPDNKSGTVTLITFKDDKWFVNDKPLMDVLTDK